MLEIWPATVRVSESRLRDMITRSFEAQGYVVHGLDDQVDEDGEFLGYEVDVAPKSAPNGAEPEASPSPDIEDVEDVERFFHVVSTVRGGWGVERRLIKNDGTDVWVFWDSSVSSLERAKETLARRRSECLGTYRLVKYVHPEELEWVVEVNGVGGTWGQALFPELAGSFATEAEAQAALKNRLKTARIMTVADYRIVSRPKSAPSGADQA